MEATRRLRHLVIKSDNTMPTLGCFVRCPVHGRVKTRLSSTLSEEFTLSLYKAFVKDIYSQMRRVAEGCSLKKALFFDSLNDKSKLSEIIYEEADFPWISQTGQALGERISNFFQWAFDSGSSSVVLIGSDAPTLPDGYIARAVEMLTSRQADVVIGPATDGGYYLIGMNKPADMGIFSGISWGSNQVFRQTLERVKTKLGILPPWYDVDNEQSYDFMKAHLFALEKSQEINLPKNTIKIIV